MIGILGGRFDPPQYGHVALARAALEQLPIDRLVVLVAERPGHREAVAGPAARLRMAQAAFGDLVQAEIVLDPHAYTVDAVRGGRFGDAVFVVGADEGAGFPSWKDPEEVLRWVKLAVGTRSGFPQPELERFGDRVSFFQFDSPVASSTEVRERLARGGPVDDLVPPAVTDVIEELGLYR